MSSLLMGQPAIRCPFFLRLAESGGPVISSPGRGPAASTSGSTSSGRGRASTRSATTRRTRAAARHLLPAKVLAPQKAAIRFFSIDPAGGGGYQIRSGRFQIRRELISPFSKWLVFSVVERSSDYVLIVYGPLSVCGSSFFFGQTEPPPGRG